MKRMIFLALLLLLVPVVFAQTAQLVSLRVELVGEKLVVGSEPIITLTAKLPEAQFERTVSEPGDIHFRVLNIHGDVLEEGYFDLEVPPPAQFIRPENGGGGLLEFTIPEHLVHFNYYTDLDRIEFYNLQGEELLSVDLRALGGCVVDDVCSDGENEDNCPLDCEHVASVNVEEETGSHAGILLLLALVVAGVVVYYLYFHKKKSGKSPGKRK